MAKRGESVTPTTPLAGERIAIVSRIYLPEPAAASFRLAALARALDRAGARTEVLTVKPPHGLPPSVDQHDKISVTRAPVLRDKNGYVRGYFQYLSFDVPAFVRVLFGPRRDLLIVEPPPTTGFFMRLAAGLRRTPYVYYAPDIWSDATESTSAPSFVVRTVRALEKFAMNGAILNLSVSDLLTARMRELGVQAPILTVGNGVDTGLFNADGDVHDIQHPYFLYAGTASEFQGAGIFVEAFARVVADFPDARLVFIGQGEDRAEIERLATTTPPGSVELHGTLPPAQAAAWIRGAVCTLASIKSENYNLGIPTKLFASVACGTPVIFTGIGPGGDFARQANLGQATEYNLDQVVAAMTRALSSPADVARRSAIATWAANNVSQDAIAERAVTEITARLN